MCNSQLVFSHQINIKSTLIFPTYIGILRFLRYGKICFINFYVTLNLHFNTQDKYMTHSKIFVYIASSEREHSLLKSNSYEWLRLYFTTRKMISVAKNKDQWSLTINMRWRFTKKKHMNLIKYQILLKGEKLSKIFEIILFTAHKVLSKLFSAGE